MKENQRRLSPGAWTGWNGDVHPDLISRFNVLLNSGKGMPGFFERRVPARSQARAWKRVKRVRTLAEILWWALHFLHEISRHIMQINHPLFV